MIKKTFFQIFNKHFKIEKELRANLLARKKDIKINTFQDWDSMKHVIILMAIEKKFKIKITDKNASYFTSFKSGLNYMEKLIEGNH
jgi:acyl carrier protein